MISQPTIAEACQIAERMHENQYSLESIADRLNEAFPFHMFISDCSSVRLLPSNKIIFSLALS
ncbi:hypothetical protein AH03_19 [Erwinia phage AH03]|uniref:Uncharacterized protein n=1 Tax=Erwinia phage AH03 TaxID=2869568 RepID=A0AAE7X0J0_9CAUD|nr:hypothetical protein AH03_19 [Erwinia phage AH03]